MEMEVLEVHDVRDACRLCLSVGVNLIGIFEGCDINEPLSLPSRIAACVGFEISRKEKLPSRICHTCLNEVDRWVVFRAQCRKANDLLTKVDGSKSQAKIVKKCLRPRIDEINLSVESQPHIATVNSQQNIATVNSQSNILTVNSQPKIATADSQPQPHISDSCEDIPAPSSREAQSELNISLVPGKGAQKEELENSDGGDDGECCNDDDDEDESDENDDDDHCEGGWEYTEDLSNSSDESEGEDGSDVEVPWRQRPVKCPLCPKAFVKHHGVKEHLKYVHTVYTMFPCTVCGHISLKSMSRTKHISKRHKKRLDNNKRMCKICGLILKARSAFYRHSKKHKDDLHCGLCNVLLESLEDVAVHLKTVHEKDVTQAPAVGAGEPRYRCHHCENVVFWKAKDWREHYLHIHNTQQVYPCNICNKAFKVKERYDAHLLEHNGEAPFMCELCASRFTTKASLRTHMKRHNDTGKFECPVCKKTFDSKGNLKMHEQSHTNEKSFVCHECGKAFKSAGGHQFHLRRHTGEKPYSCKYCDFTSASYSGVYAHRVKHFDEQPFKCEDCGKCFKMKGWLKVHKKTHSGIKKFACEICQMAFIANYQLKSHMKVHSGERPHVCDICSKSFVRKDTLTEHRRTHTKETKYTCKHCNLEFMFLKPFKKHKCVPSCAPVSDTQQLCPNLSSNSSEDDAQTSTPYTDM